MLKLFQVVFIFRKFHSMGRGGCGLLFLLGVNKERVKRERFLLRQGVGLLWGPARVAHCLDPGMVEGLLARGWSSC